MNDDTKKSNRMDEVFFENIYNNSTIGFYRTTPEGKIIRANPAVVKLLGFNSFSELFERDLEEEGFSSNYPRDEYKRMLEENVVIKGFESQWVKKDGEIVYVRENARAVRDNDGKIIYYDGSIEDVTDRKKEELKEKHLKQVLLAVRNVNQLIVNEDNVARLLQRACDNLTETLGYHIAWIVQQDDKGEMIDIYASGIDNNIERLKKSFTNGQVPHCVKAAGNRDKVVVYDNPKENCIDCLLANNYIIESSLVKRLDYGNKVFGVLVVSIPAEFSKNKEEIELFEELCGDVSFALHKIYLQKFLQAREKKYKQFVETANEAILEVDNAGVITFFNDKFRNMIGFEKEQILGKSYETFVHPDDVELHREMLQLRKKGFRSVYEKRLVRKDGTTVWTMHSASSSYNLDGEIIGAFGMVTDISDLKIAELELAEKSRFLETLMNNLPGVVYSCDYDKNRTMRYLSGRVEELTGYKPVEIIDNKVKAYNDIIVDKYRETIFQKWKEAIKERNIFDEEYEIVTADGSRKCVWERSVGVFNEKDEVERLEGFIMDVTDKKRFRLQLIDSEQKYRNLAESIDSIIWEYDIINDRWTYVAPQVTKILGYKPEEWTNLDFWKHNLHPQDREWAYKYCLDCAMRGEKHTFEYRFKHKKGKYVWLKDVVSVEMKGNKAVVLRGFMVDIDQSKKTELALQKEKKRLEAFFNIVPDYLLITNSNYDIIRMSKSWEKLLGLPLTILERKKILDFIHPDDVCETKEIISSICQGKEYDYSVNRYKSVDGSYRHLEWFAQYSDGLVFAVARDVTEKVDESNILQELVSASEGFLEQTSSEIDYHQIAEKMLRLSGAMLVAFNVYEGDQGDFRTAAIAGLNKKLQKGISFLGFNLEGHLWKNDPVRADKISKSSVTRFKSLSGLVGDVIPKPITYSLEMLFKTSETVVIKIVKDEVVFGDFTIIMPAYRNLENEELLEIYARQVGLLITRVEAELFLKKAKDQLQKVIDANPNFNYVKDYDGRYLLINRAMADNFGYQPAEILGKTDKELWIHQDLVERYIETDKEVIDKNEPLFVPEEKVHCNDGSTRWLQVYKIPIDFGESKRKAVLGVAVDITHRKESEDVLRQKEEELFQAVKMSAIGRLAGGIAHDFNNLLHAIIGYSDMAIAAIGDTNENVRSYLEEIKRAGNSSANLTKQLLAFARRQTYKPVVVNLNDAINSLMLMLKHVIDENILFDWHPADEVFKIKIDPTQLQQILINLVVNARDALDEVEDGKITLETKSIKIDEKFVNQYPHFSIGKYNTIFLTDNGCGISKEIQSHIFEPFFTTKEPGKGTGLGLATVYGIVRQNEGIITVESEIGKGSTFTIYFPDIMEEVEPAITQPETDNDIQKGTETILLVEDDEVLLSLVSDMLLELGYNVIKHNKPSEALKMFKDTNPSIQLLITDVIMPGMNGKDLWVQLKAFNSDIHCLFISGYTANIINHDNIIDYDVHFLQKPFTVRKLGNKIQHILGKSEN